MSQVISSFGEARFNIHHLVRQGSISHLAELYMSLFCIHFH